MEIAELMLGIYLAKVLHTPDGMLMEYREVIRLAERAFGVKNFESQGVEAGYFQTDERAGDIPETVDLFD